MSEEKKKALEEIKQISKEKFDAFKQTLAKKFREMKEHADYGDVLSLEILDSDIKKIISNAPQVFRSIIEDHDDYPLDQFGDSFTEIRNLLKETVKECEVLLKTLDSTDFDYDQIKEEGYYSL